MEEKIPAKKIMNQMLANVYVKAFEAKKAGKLICWATGVAPQEIMTTMDITTVYPENFGAAMGAKHISGSLIEKAEAQGYAIDTCSYARNNFGYIEVGQVDDPVNLPMPDLVLCCSNTCNTVIKWYENLGKQLNIPVLFLDTPYNYCNGQSQYGEGATGHQVAFMVEQFKHMITQLEEITGRKFDWDRFTEVMKISMESGRWWLKGISVTKFKPAPINGFDFFNYMGIMVCERGTPEGRDLFKQWYEESMEAVQKGQGPWKDQEEKYRIMWDGIACWPQLAMTGKLLKKYGINLVCSSYPMLWNLAYDEPTLEAMAKAYSENLVPNRELDYDYNAALQMIRDYDLDGIIHHSNRSCKPMDFKQYEIRRRLTEETGIPSILFDGDQTDPRVFSEAQFETRLQALVEIMEKNKMGRK